MKKTAPTKPEIALLEPFAGLTLERIHVPTTSAGQEIEGACGQLRARVVKAR